MKLKYWILLFAIVDIVMYPEYQNALGARSFGFLIAFNAVFLLVFMATDISEGEKLVEI